MKHNHDSDWHKQTCQGEKALPDVPLSKTCIAKCLERSCNTNATLSLYNGMQHSVHFKQKFVTTTHTSTQSVHHLNCKPQRLHNIYKKTHLEWSNTSSPFRSLAFQVKIASYGHFNALQQITNTKSTHSPHRQLP